MSRLDISPSNGLDLDERSALEHFLGKNQEDAVALFEENFGYYTEELAYMGNNAFFYYLGSAKSYLERNEDQFEPSDYEGIARDLLVVFRCKKEEIQEPNECYLWIISFVINHLNKIINDDNSWVEDYTLTSEKKIRSLIRRWGELGLPNSC